VFERSAEEIEALRAAIRAVVDDRGDVV